jgi:hypothetical protein
MSTQVSGAWNYSGRRKMLLSAVRMERMFLRAPHCRMGGYTIDAERCVKQSQRSLALLRNEHAAARAKAGSL